MENALSGSICLLFLSDKVQSNKAWKCCYKERKKFCQVCGKEGFGNFFELKKIHLQRTWLSIDQQSTKNSPQNEVTQVWFSTFLLF